MRTRGEANPAPDAREHAEPGRAEPVRLPDWVSRFPWLTQASTGRGLDLRTYGLPHVDAAGGAAGNPAASLRGSGSRASWRRLAEVEGLERVVLTRQVHGRRVLVHGAVPAEGLDPREHHSTPPEADGHVTNEPGVMLAVTVADCVPVFVVDPESRSVAALHAGWRGAAAGILAECLGVMAVEFGTRPRDVYIHLGPAICGTCYEVGPEVHEALGLRVPSGPTPVDVAAVLRAQARAHGVLADRITRDALCTLEAPGLYSHRGGDSGRQVGYIGIRERA